MEHNWRGKMAAGRDRGAVARQQQGYDSPLRVAEAEQRLRLPTAAELARRQKEPNYIRDNGSSMCEQAGDRPAASILPAGMTEQMRSEAEKAILAWEESDRLPTELAVELFLLFLGQKEEKEGARR